MLRFYRIPRNLNSATQATQWFVTCVNFDYPAVLHVNFNDESLNLRARRAGSQLLTLTVADVAPDILEGSAQFSSSTTGTGIILHTVIVQNKNEFYFTSCKKNTRTFGYRV